MKNQCGNAKQCKTLVKDHHVYVNGEVVDDVRYQVSVYDDVVVDGVVMNAQPFVYYMMNKPTDCICASRDDQYTCVVDYIDRDDCYYLGRLDKDTTGLLILTNDTSLSKGLLLPDNHVEKTYFVEVDHCLNESLYDTFSQGVIIDKDIVCHSAIYQQIDHHHCYITIDEGKYHQIKKMFLSCGYRVIRLKRVSFAGLTLDDSLKEGEFRSLTNEEIEYLCQMAKRRG